MGKSIIHCATCGKAIREDDFATGKASMSDSMSYCSSCRAVSPAAASRTLDLQKSSTSRIPVSSHNNTRRVVAAVDSRIARAPLWAAGALVGIGLIVLLVFLFSGKSGGRVETAAPASEAKSRGPQEPVAKRESIAPAPERKVEGEEAVKPPPEPERRVDPAAKPEKVAPPRLRLKSPVDGAKFLAPADIVFEAELQDPGERIARIEFWQGSIKVGESKVAPYRCEWKGVESAGRYPLKARLIDRAGAEIESSAVWIMVEAPAAEVAKAASEAETPKPALPEPAKEKPVAAEGKAPAPKKEPLPQVDQKKVDAAIKKGVNFLVSQVGKLAPAYAKNPTKESRTDEIVLWTFVHAGVSETSPVFRHVFKTVTEAELKRTYEASLQAMILEELDRVRYQGRIFQCAQFLADNECTNGQWHYGEPVPPSTDVPTTGLPMPTASRSSGAAGERQKPLVVRKLKVTPRKTGPAEGDNSNAQYAALGIRACTDAGISFPDESLQRARKWFRGSQHSAAAGAGSGVATGGEKPAPPAGWCYFGKNHEGHNAYGSMTAGAVGAIAIYDTLLGEDWRKDRAVASGISWMAKNFSASTNPGPPSESWCKADPHWQCFYYLYALERAGVLCRTEWIGTHPWYFEGAGFLLANQEKDGSWNGNAMETCFAILFLKRATRPLEDVASQDDKARK